MRTCIKCGRELPDGMFSDYWYNKRVEKAVAYQQRRQIFVEATRSKGDWKSYAIDSDRSVCEFRLKERPYRAGRGG